ncbi:hypothetical protein COCMIDRAFT_24974 [Bipolaris oryzae ATCC 44560]|uniref:Uncharacterized protein n=1 Tax=Bipolaris oryzae ATCC 44560 TaxID=930090 RepID=W6ZI14_COCMI|nr:uncharacterized protein COCMIDRAFT_24974 [Bipolaris oryzae ATCC 44560]EUC47054.1 hypothetical protein COCMIDRAFT_24974 [Bipolaris oryzae ATCC 44560]
MEPPAIKKRGRPKKVAAENAGETIVVEPKKMPAVNNATTKPVVSKDKVVAPEKDKKTIAKKNAPEHPTPVAPATSKILESVRAKGTLSKTLPTKPANLESRNSGTPPATKPATTATAQAPPISSSPPPPQPKPARTYPTPTTIPLPQKPLPAPSPISSTSHTTSPRNPVLPPNPYPSTPRRIPPALSQHTRVIEPTPDIRLPPKYKPAARRVTAIIVSLPIVLVFGYELLERWRGKKEVKVKFGGERGA